MLKRIIGVITVKDNWVVQSIGYKKYRPIGKINVVLENLDRWQLEEILVVDINRSKNDLGPNFELLDSIVNEKIATPLAYAGGIRNSEDAVKVINAGADRIGLERLFDSNPDEFLKVSGSIGCQAVILMQALTFHCDDIYKYCYISGKSFKLTKNYYNEYQDFFSEMMVIDYINEGHPNSFNENLPIQLEIDKQIICFGGVSTATQIKNLFRLQNVSAVGIGNFLNYKELANWQLVKNVKLGSNRRLTYGKQSRGIMEWH